MRQQRFALERLVKQGDIHSCSNRAAAVIVVFVVVVFVVVVVVVVFAIVFAAAACYKKITRDESVRTVFLVLISTGVSLCQLSHDRDTEYTMLHVSVASVLCGDCLLEVRL